MASMSLWRVGEIINENFDLCDKIDHLPAASFLWSNLVAPENKERYCKLLGEMLQLFLSPHYYDSYPYRECSYLKKYELVNKSDSGMMISSFLMSLASENALNNVQINPGVLSLHVDTLEPTGFTHHYSDASLEEVVLNWYFNTNTPPLLLVAIDVLLDPNSSHATFLAIKKYPVLEQFNPLIKFQYFDSQGYQENETLQIRFPQVKEKLKSILEPHVPNIRILQLLMNCPQFQYEEQGGNCVQWRSMIFSYIVHFPENFENPNDIIRKISYYPQLNVTLFSLAMFLRTIGPIELYQYYYAMFPPYAFTEKAQIECLGEGEKATSSFAWSIQAPSCELYMSDCPNSCTYCGGKCLFKAASKMTEEGECHRLSPKDIAREMFVNYFMIKEMTVGHEDASSSIQEMEHQLNFPEFDSTNPDYYQGLVKPL